ncbi:MAG: phosphohydrolase [Treponema sp.]|nr:phosphohydrolase [Treponema sp.]
MKRSRKENKLDNELIEAIRALNLSGKAETAMNVLLSDDELQAAQEYANIVSIVRLGFNDHGPVHMRIVAMNGILMLKLLHDAGVKTSLEKDGCGDFEDSLIAVISACMLHDVGMGVGRQDHELHSINLSHFIIDRLVRKVYGSDMQKQVMVRALTVEGITGHMGARAIHSLEAGVVQVADGCDMTKGRARIPIQLGLAQKIGHIHQYSANSIDNVCIKAGQEKPIRVDVYMSNEAGYFQVEEVLLKKIAGSTAKTHIELYAQVRDEEARQYL